MTPPPPIRAVIFDMDGLLLDSERVYMRAFEATCAALGVSVSRADYRRLVGRSGPDGRAALEEVLDGAATLADFDAVWDGQIAGVFDRPVPLRPGAFELTTHLLAAGTPVAVATSTSRAGAIRRLTLAGLPALAEGPLVGGDEIARRKPAPDIYLAAARLLGIGPDLCAAFEDSTTGVRAALAAGCVTTQVPDLQPVTDETRALGHAIAPDLLTGARALGIYPAT